MPTVPPELIAATRKYLEVPLLPHNAEVLLVSLNRLHELSSVDICKRYEAAPVTASQLIVPSPSSQTDIARFVGAVRPGSAVVVVVVGSAVVDELPPSTAL